MRRIAAVIAAVALAAGCCLLEKVQQARAPKPAPATFSQYHQEGWEWDRVDRVLVLPFLNNSEYTHASDEVRAAFTSEFQRMGRFEVVNAAPDDRAVLAAQIHRGGQFDEVAMLELARSTNSDVVVHGIVTHYSPYPRPRIGLVIQAVGPRHAKVVASVDGLWDTTDCAVAERCRIFYRQRLRPLPPWIARNHVIATDDGFAGELALESPALFQRWVSHEAILALMGLPVPGVISPGMNSQAPTVLGPGAGPQPNCQPGPPPAPAAKVK